MRRYIQYYKYDEVGNVLQMKHTTSGGTGNWTRDFTPDSTSNKLSDSSIGSDATGTESYNYDARGNIADGMNHLLAMDYNHANRLEKLEVTVTITTYYQYDSNGQRVRKVTENTGAALRYERRYIAGWEAYRETDTGTNTTTLERETLHVMDDTARVAIIDTPTIDTLSSGEVQTLRYLFSNHLGTASLELDDAADVISYEEYYPYGNTSYQAGRSTAEVSLKRYRYVGKERDDESGLYYIGARYYCPWLARWLEPDPINSEWYNISQGSPTRNLERQFVELTASSYEYCYANPVRFTDLSGEQVPPRERESDSFTKNMAEGAARGAQDNTKVDDSHIKMQIALDKLPPPNDHLSSSISETKEHSFSEKTKHWLSEQSILSPFAWVTGHSSPPPSAAQDLAKPMTYFAPGVGFGKALTESGIGLASGNPTAGDYVNLGLAVLPYGKSLANAKMTTTDGFLLGSINVKSPMDISAQRFGNMSLNKEDFWTLQVTGESEFVNRTFVAIKPQWNPLTQYTTGTIPKGSTFKIGFVGPQGFKNPGGFIQFKINSQDVINQSTKIIKR